MKIEEVIKKIDEENRNRDAYASIDGYFYQFDLTLLHLLKDGTSEDSFNEKRNNNPAQFKLESIEDYVKYYEEDDKQNIRIAQIKHHTTTAGTSKYYEAVLYLYLNFLRFKSLNETNFNYKAVIFHFDTSPNDKDMSVALENAMKYNEDREEEKRLKPYLLILEIEKHIDIDIDEVRKEFVENSKFTRCESLYETRLELVRKLKERYQTGLIYRDEEGIYATAVSKLINDGAKKETISLEKLDEYFKTSQYVNADFYTRRAITEIYYYIDQNIATIYKSNEVTNRPDVEVISRYEKIYQDLKLFMKKNFEEPKLRKSFLYSVTSNNIKNYLVNSQSEIEAIIETSSAIRSFLAKLVKIIYTYEEMFGDSVDLAKWFNINDDLWLFQYPFEERKRGIILGDIITDHNVALYVLLDRFSKIREKPKVLYSNALSNIKANRKIYLQNNILKIQDQSDSEVTSIEDYYFYVQCLNCLNIWEYETIEKVSNIFKRNCQGI